MPRFSLKSKREAASQKLAADVSGVVKVVIDDIRNSGDEAVLKYSTRFDSWSPKSFRLSQAEIDDAISRVPQQTLDDIKQVQRNVRQFAIAQRESITDFELETQEGVFLGQKNVPISTVGAYIPGGRYPLLASAHMTILTAKAAGVEHVVGCTPPIKGSIPCSTVAAMHFAGADEIFLLGGVQAIAAMAVGTETIRKVDFIAGPGNAFVAEAKRQLFGDIGIDLLAGPTEILVVADDAADPFTIATDLISQAEHGPDSPAVLVTTSEAIGRRTLQIIERILETLDTAAVARVSWEDFGEIIVVDSIEDAYSLADEYSYEHVQIFTREPRDALQKMKHYGALFLGEKTCVSYGDKVIGTNHVLPTKNAARYTGGLWVGKFLRTVTYQEVKSKKASGELGLLCGRAARAENFEGHARSGDLRSHQYLGNSYEWITKGKETD